MNSQVLSHMRFALVRPCFRRSLSTSYDRLAASYWTSDRVGWLTNGHDDPLSPDKPGVAPLLRVLGILNPDGSLGADKLKKYKQLSSMYSAIEHAVADPLHGTRSQQPLRFVDLCSGSSSHIALLLAFAARHRWERPAHIIAVDADAARVANAEQRAALLGFGAETLRYATSRVASLGAWQQLYPQVFPGHGSQPPHGVFALHACDTATDEALHFGVRSRAHALLVAPCCQAELAAAWKELALRDEEGGPRQGRRSTDERRSGGRAARGGGSVVTAAAAAGASSFGLVHRQPNLRREVASHITDALRLALLRGQGYRVDVAEFVSAEHTPKNRLFTAIRHRGASDDAGGGGARGAAIAEYCELRDATGGCGITLGALLGADQ